jgi:hypothetical protein
MKLATRVPRHPIANLTSWLFVTFLVLFPKGGFKVGSTPLTWGYLMLGMSALPLIGLRIVTMQWKVTVLLLTTVVSVIPFQILFVYSYFQNGIEDLGYVISSFVGFFILPGLFILVYPAFLSWINAERFRKHLSFSILAAAIYGIFLFFWHPITGSFIEVPFLTVNAGDYGLLETTKHIDRGSFFKLISTYNNGNVYGVATLILLPLYNAIEERRWKRVVLKVALVLTLSRTVWAGLILDQILSVGAQLGSQLSSFPRFHVLPVLRRGMLLFATLGLVFVGLALNGNGFGFLFDKDLGGRGGQLDAFINPTFLPGKPLTGFAEMVYSSSLNTYGVAGLLAIVLIFVTPILIVTFNPATIKIPSRRAGFKGLIIYAALAGIDGATSLIPVMAFYWFAYMTFLMGLPGESASTLGEVEVHHLATEIFPSGANDSPSF